MAHEVWSGDAAVHVSIVNWTKGEFKGSKQLITQLGDSIGSAWKIKELPTIPPSLRSGFDVTGAIVLPANEKAKKCFTGQNPVNAGFFLTPEEAANMLRADPRNREVLFPYMIGRDLVEHYGPTRWIIDFAKRDLFAARSYPLPFAHVEQWVMPKVLARAEKEKVDTGKEVTRYTRLAQRWWQFYDYRPGTIAAINSVPRWIALSRTSKRPIFEFVSREIHADSKLMVFAFADDYSFGVLSSDLHWQWTVARGSTLKRDQNYTSDTVFDSFPWPQNPTDEQIRGIADAAIALRKLRRGTMDKLKYSLRQLYRTLEQPGDNPLRDAHARLDAAVRAAYGVPQDADPLPFLLELNLACAAKEKAGEKITAPGLPLPQPDHGKFITNDSVTASGAARDA